MHPMGRRGKSPACHRDVGLIRVTLNMPLSGCSTKIVNRAIGKMSCPDVPPEDDLPLAENNPDSSKQMFNDFRSRVGFLPGF